MARKNRPGALGARPWLLGALLSGLTGCATVATLDANKAGAPVVYAGTRLDLYLVQGGCCPQDRFGALGPKYPGLDLPGSALIDTLLLPLSLLTAAGVGYSAQGGL